MDNNQISPQHIPLKINNSIKKQKLKGLIFTRACCCIGIVVYHYFCHSKGDFKLLYSTANSSFGFIFVTAFFNISGACLYYNYPIIKSITFFYYKRWKSIFPSYYLSYAYFYISRSLQSHKLVFKGFLSNIYFTILGLDGYFLYRIKTCYLIGEWFLGAIIIIYFFYPYFAFIDKKNYYIFALILCFSNIFIYYSNFFIIIRSRNIITCITSFYFGMTTIKFKNIFFGNNISFIISSIIFILLSKIKVSSLEIIFQIQGFSFFIAITKIGQYIMHQKYSKIFIEISNLSFSIYLFHHIIIKDILAINNPFKWHSHLLILSLSLSLTIICSKIHLMVFDSIIKSNIFLKLESLFI